MKIADNEIPYLYLRALIDRNYGAIFNDLSKMEFMSNSISNSIKNNDELEYIPISSVINPLGTILYGPNPEPINHDKRFRLELFYTEINN